MPSYTVRSYIGHGLQIVSCNLRVTNWRPQHVYSIPSALYQVLISPPSTPPSLLAFAPDLLTRSSPATVVDREQSFFVARFFLAAIAPLLFARVLSLAQVDEYLGPMTQVPDRWYRYQHAIAKPQQRCLWSVMVRIIRICVRKCEV